jgi:hypothetical protein
MIREERAACPNYAVTTLRYTQAARFQKHEGKGIRVPFRPGEFGFMDGFPTNLVETAQRSTEP